MAEMSTAQVAEITVDAETLNRMPLADIFVAVGPARVVAEGVSVGPVMTDQGVKFLVRFDGKVGQLAGTENEVLDLAGPSIRRHVLRLDGLRARAKAFAEWSRERAAKIATCPGHIMHGRPEGRGHVLFCKLCGFSDGINSAD